MLNAAIEDGLIATNPAAKAGASLEVDRVKVDHARRNQSHDESQRQLFLATAYREAPRYYPLFFVLAGTGCGWARRWPFEREDVDFSAKTIRIARAFSEDGALDTPKSGHGRTVDMSQSLADSAERPMR